MTEALTYIEIDVDYCSLLYGTTNGAGTCPAVLGVDSDIKCFNTIKTCAVRDSFTNVPVTLRFAVPADYLPADIEALPNIASISYSPAVVSLGEDLGQRASLSVTFNDHPHSDTGSGGDPYLSDRTYNPWDQGSYWAKFRSRQPFLRGRPMRRIRGVVGQALADMESRLFLMESFEGPSLDGKFTITAKDALKLADGDRAQAPVLSPGSLNADITDSATSATLTPSGIGNSGGYPGSGYLNIGGSEIVAFQRDTYAGNDANAKLLLHFDGNLTDSSASARTATAVNSAATATTDPKFGSASLSLNGTNQYVTFPDSADWTFGGDFTVDCNIKSSSLAALQTVFSHSTDANNQYRLRVETSGALKFEIISASVSLMSMTSATGLIATGTKYHVAVVRSSNAWTIYLNGVSVATYSGAVTIPNYTSTFRVGTGGAATSFFAGLIDEFRVSNVARWTAAFAAPVSAYQSSADLILLTARAQFNTDAAAHSAGDRCQVCLSYSGQDPADVTSDLFQTYAGVASSYVPLTDWQAETAAFYRRLVTTLICEPTPVNTLIGELVEQCGLAIWWDDVGRKIRLQVLRAISTEAETFDDSNVLEGSLTISEQPDKRISQIWTYYAVRNPLKPLTPDNFRSVSVKDDLDAEEDYGQPAVKTIFSRWIPFGGETAAQRLNEIQLGRYGIAPRHFGFNLPRTDQVSPELAEGCRLEGQPMQDATGARENVPIQIVRLQPEADRYVVEAEEQLFTDLSSDDPTTDAIIISADGENVDLRALHDSLYAVAQSGDTVVCTINSGITVGSSSTSLPAFLIDNGWASGVIIQLIVKGRIQGHGGDGGEGATDFGGSGHDGLPGGTALEVQTAIALDLTTGDAEIFGGGGGGPGTGPTYALLGQGGGGGAGTDPGAGGPGGGTSGFGAAPAGDPGTSEAGGAGAPDGGYGAAGDGGDPGQPGGAAASAYHYHSPGSVGAAGTAIDGVSHCTITGTGDVRGPTTG